MLPRETYYIDDQRCGSEATVNGKNAYNLFNADLISVTMTPGAVATDYSLAIGSSSLFVNNHDVGIGNMEVKFYVGGAYKEDSELNVTNLIAECRRCVFSTDEDPFEYDAVLTGYDYEETGVPYFTLVELRFAVVKRLPMVTRTFTISPATFVNDGSMESGMILKVTPLEDVASATAAGITMTGLLEDVPWYINGIDGTVTSNGVNKFLATDLIDFPKAVPGRNTLEFDSTVTVEISYYPTFIV